MALVAGLPWSVSFSFIDNNGNRAVTGVNYPEALDFADVLTRATELATRLQAISNASLQVVSISRVLSENAAPVPQPESEVERKLRIPLGTAVRQPGAAAVEIPSPLFAIETPGTDVVPATNLLLSSVVAELTAGGVGPGNGVVTIEGSDITRAGTSVIVHRTRAPRR